MNKKQFRMREKNLKQSIAFLAGFVSPIFKEKRPKPLKIGIDKDVRNVLKEKNIDFPDKLIARALFSYIKRAEYQKAIVKRKMRYDLDGNAVEPILPEHKEDSIAFLKAVRKRTKAYNLEIKKRKAQFKARQDAKNAERAALAEETEKTARPILSLRKRKNKVNNKA